MLRAPLRGMPRPCDYSRGSVFAWNRLEALIEETMLYLSTAEKVRETDLLALGTKHLDMGTPFESAEALRDHLIELTVPLLKSVEYLDRVLAGCCWEVLISGKDPDDSIGALRQAAKSLTLTLASYLADSVAETLQARAGLAIATKRFLQLVETKKAPN